MPRGLTAACLAVALAAGCTHDDPDEGRIVFQSSRSGEWAVYSMRPDGRDLRRIAYDGDGYSVTLAYWSPRGERMFVPVYRDGREEGVVVDTRDGTRTRIRVNALGGLAWSPDATRLAVAGERGILVIDADGTNRRQLTRNPDDSEPAWSPDGERIAFASGADLYTIAADGGRVSRVLSVDEGGDVSRPLWSADGEWLAFSHIDYETGLAPLEVVRADGRERRRVVGDVAQYAWSPREPTLLFVHASDVHRIDVDGTDRQRLTFDGPGLLFDRSLSWSPDGERIAYVRPRLARGIRDPARPTDVWLMNADGSGKRPLTRAFPTGGSNEFSDWVEVDPRATPVRTPALSAVRLRTRSVLRTRQPIGGLAASGSRAIVAHGLGSATEFVNPPGPLLVWEPLRARTRPIPVRRCGAAAEPALAGQRVAYVCNNTVVDLIADQVRIASRAWTATVADLRATHLVGAPFASRLLQGMAASDRLVVFGVGEVPRPKVVGPIRPARTDIWRVQGRGRRKIATFKREARVADADATRVAVVHGRRVVIVSRSGASLSQLAIGRTGVVDVELDGDRVVVLLPERIAIYDAATGRRRASRRLPSDAREPRGLAGVHGELAAYVTGTAIRLLRLVDGRTIVVDTRSAAEPVYAALTEAGLFYSYTDSSGVPAGRAVFVARAEVERALVRAGRP